jgi:hypothetical protein
MNRNILAVGIDQKEVLHTLFVQMSVISNLCQFSPAILTAALET